MPTFKPAETAKAIAGPTMGRLLKQYMWPYRLRFIGALVAMALVAATTAGFAYMLEPLVNYIFDEQREELVLPLAGAVLALFVVNGLASFGQALLMNDIGRRVVARVQREVFERIVHADLAYINSTDSGRLIGRMKADTGLLFSAVSSTATALGKDLLTVIALVVAMMIQDMELFLVTFVCFPIAVIPIVMIGRKSRKLSKITQETVGRQFSELGEVMRSVRHVKAYNAEEREIERANKVIWYLAQLGFKKARVAAISNPIMQTLAGVAMTLVIIFGAYQVIDGVRQPGTFMSFVAALLLAYEPLKRLAGLNAALQVSLAGAERVFEMIDREPTIVDAPGAIDLPRVTGEVRFANVHFAYSAGTTVPALRGVTLSIPAGSTAALVGPSGAGKTTVLNLIPRFYDVTAGAISIDGHDVRDVTMQSLRANLALVSQDVTLFNDTVRSNIAYGRPGASDDDIVAAAKAAAAHDFIEALPKGYDTIVGESGVRLSGGQRQRLSIARAVLKDAPVLLLDEATSALDTESERLVQTALEALMKGRTSIVIAHRLSTVINADTIYVMSEGQIAEQGNHGELVARGGLYARLWSMQTRPADEVSPIARTGR